MDNDKFQGFLRVISHTPDIDYMRKTIADTIFTSSQKHNLAKLVLDHIIE